MTPPKDSFRRRMFWSVLVIGAAALAMISAWYVAAYLVGVLALWFLFVHAIPPKAKKDSKS